MIKDGSKHHGTIRNNIHNPHNFNHQISRDNGSSPISHHHGNSNHSLDNNNKIEEDIEVEEEIQIEVEDRTTIEEEEIIQIEITNAGDVDRQDI